MAEALHLLINGQQRALELVDGATVNEVVAALGMVSDRIALEVNGVIVSRTAWAITEMRTDDRLEIVHFVGGGMFDAAR